LAKHAQEITQRRQHGWPIRLEKFNKFPDGHWESGYNFTLTGFSFQCSARFGENQPTEGTKGNDI
jgi:hypothetical protein